MKPSAIAMIILSATFSHVIIAQEAPVNTMPAPTQAIPAPMTPPTSSRSIPTNENKEALGGDHTTTIIDDNGNLKVAKPMPPQNTPGIVTPDTPIPKGMVTPSTPIPLQGDGKGPVMNAPVPLQNAQPLPGSNAIMPPNPVQKAPSNTSAPISGPGTTPGQAAPATNY